MKYSRTFKKLGTVIEIILVSKSTANKKAGTILDLIEEEYSNFDKKFSRFNPKSELSHLNNNLGKSVYPSADLFFLSKKALEFHKVTKGLFDPRVLEPLELLGYKKDFSTNDFLKIIPANAAYFKTDISNDIQLKRDCIKISKPIDFGGLGKGFITDKISRLIKESGWMNFVINSGGDIFAAGNNDQDKKWQIALEGFPEKKFIVQLSDESIATSGITRKKWQKNGKNFHHLINPFDPTNFSTKIKSVSVIARTTLEADVWAKALFLMGKKRGLEFSRKKGIKTIFLDYRGNVFLSPKTKENVLIS